MLIGQHQPITLLFLKEFFLCLYDTFVDGLDILRAVVRRLFTLEGGRFVFGGFFDFLFLTLLLDYRHLELLFLDYFFAFAVDDL